MTKHKHKAKSDSTGKLLKTAAGAAAITPLVGLSLSTGAALAHA